MQIVKLSVTSAGNRQMLVFRTAQSPMVCSYLRLGRSLNTLDMRAETVTVLYGYRTLPFRVKSYLATQSSAWLKS